MTWLIAAGIVAGIVSLLAGAVVLSMRLKSRSQSVAVYYGLVPVEKPKKRRVPISVRWIDAKGKLCKPFPE